MEKVDVKKQFRQLYSPSPKDFSLVDVPPLRFLMTDGEGDPNNSPLYTTAVSSLYATSYTLKFASKTELQRDYVVPPLEGVWWADDPASFINRSKEKWCWTMMIMVPEWIPDAMVDAAMVKAAGKGEAMAPLRVETYAEGLSVQILHIGPYDDEGPTLARLHNEYMPAHGLTFNGNHHEIYLSDPRRTQPSRLKTILRQPVTRRDAG